MRLAGSLLRGRQTQRCAITHRPNFKVTAVMGSHHYQTRAEILKDQGLKIYDFGQRALRESCFGDDVATLQVYLVDEGYLNASDGGPTGYFGSVTKEALQNWQRDHKLTSNGIFNGDCRWTYLKQQEARYNSVMRRVSLSAQAQQPPVTHPATFNIGIVYTVVAIGVAVASIRLVHALSGTVTTSIKELAKATISSLFPAKEQRMEATYEEDIEYFEEDDKLDTIQRPSSSARRLSDEEIQARIAPMKKKAPENQGSRIARPIRPSVGVSINSEDPSFVPSRHGQYYGGRAMYDRIKQLVLQESVANADGIGASGSSSKMQSLGFNTSSSASMRRPARPQIQRPAPPAAKPTRLERPFQDVAESPNSPDHRTYSSDDENLLSGTELALPAEVQPTLPPIRVVRPSGRMPVVSPTPPKQDVTARQSVAQPAPKPVAIVKPSRLAPEELSVKNEEKSLDPSATVVLSNKPVNLHKPARLAQQDI